MTHFGVICPPYLGHLNPMLALGGELQRRGHAVSILALPELADLAHTASVAVAPLRSDDGRRLALADLKSHMAAPRGFGLFRIMGDMGRMTDLLCREAPRMIASHGIDALLVDQLEPAGALVAEHLGLPYLSVANALPIDRDPRIPPPFTDWGFDPSPAGVERNSWGYRIADLMMSGLARTLARWCATWRLPVRRRIDQFVSPLAQVSQMVAGFDFPRSVATATRNCGPFRSPGPLAGTEPIDVAPPFVFASLGTLQGGRFDLFRSIAAACAQIGVRLVIAHGGGLSSDQVSALPGATIARRFVSQPEVLRRAALAVTNGGLNTVLDSLAEAVPVVTVPIAFEQGAIGARVAFAGAGRSVPLRRASPAILTEVIGDALSNADMKASATRLAAEIRAAGGVKAAADTIELALARAEPNAITRRVFA